MSDQPNGKTNISTIAIIDLETSNLPQYNFNRVSITELCIYAFDPALLKENKLLKKSSSNDDPPETVALPLVPRVLHKLNLLFQPSTLIHPVSERITGLDNFILERESKLDKNAGEIILKFLGHLRPPVCLVAHNGWYFDFPIIKQALKKLNLSFPNSMVCVDSLRAFMEIDDKLSEQVLLENDFSSDIIPIEPPILAQETKKAINWQAINETTPKRPILSDKAKMLKRKMLSDETDEEDIPATKLRSRRALFSDLKCSQTKRFPKRGHYKLPNMFERIFRQPAANAHQAEADVNMLLQLIQHYGMDFLAFAEEQAIPITEVESLVSER